MALCSVNLTLFERVLQCIMLGVWAACHGDFLQTVWVRSVAESRCCLVLPVGNISDIAGSDVVCSETRHGIMPSWPTRLVRPVQPSHLAACHAE